MHFKIKARDETGECRVSEEPNLQEFTLETAFVDEDLKPLRIRFTHEFDAGETKIIIEDEKSGRAWVGSVSLFIDDLVEGLERRRTDGTALQVIEQLIGAGQDVMDQVAEGKEQPLMRFYHRVDEVKAHIGEPTDYEHTTPDIDEVMEDLETTVKELSLIQGMWSQL
jgi:hypothetical protein